MDSSLKIAFGFFKWKFCVIEKGMVIDMNVLHMKYAVEVARIGSINKAAEELYVAQPNLSRCIKELEADLGITIFDRSSRGMNLTPQGEEFIGQAKKALDQIDGIEKMYKSGAPIKQRFSISVPRASYIADAFACFSKNLSSDPAEIFYMETNASQTVSNVLSFDYKLGIIRYASSYDKYFRQMLEEKGLDYEVVAEFRYVLLVSRESPIAGKDTVTLADLAPLMELCHGDPYVPTLPASTVMKEENPDITKRRIMLFERGGQFDLLTENPETFMWVSPLPQKLLDRYGLVQLKCTDNVRTYKDVLIRRADYSMTELDKQFITALIDSKRRCLKG